MNVDQNSVVADKEGMTDVSLDDFDLSIDALQKADGVVAPRYVGSFQGLSECI